MTARIQNIIDFRSGARPDRKGARRSRDPDALLVAIEFRLTEIEGEMDAALMIEDFETARDRAKKWAFLSRQRQALRARAVDERMGAIRALEPSS